MKLTSKDGELIMKGFYDADWARDNIDRKSCTGYVFNSQGGAVSWCSRRQQTVALSTAEAEYMVEGINDILYRAIRFRTGSLKGARNSETRELVTQTRLGLPSQARGTDDRRGSARVVRDPHTHTRTGY
ncbi:Retrovirus-related Pol polyprotein from transposon TNT 1-94 [Eumeta japonica]|uniref:Retrovirus-related Pol polyprotein from transposon TNT 1-94 n=1 Tax=Eumeta variegata TaxID=151549 RepID=A0A4C1SLZ6_EUMVA|nr:Retrovirus-related Pol polyprotein from transposon TNT 1-94 [Eumeta japonica]